MFSSEFGIQEELEFWCMLFSRRFSSGVWSLVFATGSRSIGNSKEGVRRNRTLCEAVVLIVRICISQIRYRNLYIPPHNSLLQWKWLSFVDGSHGQSHSGTDNRSCIFKTKNTETESEPNQETEWYSNFYIIDYTYKY